MRSPTAARALLIPLLREAPDLAAISDRASWDHIKGTANRYGVAQLIAYTVREHVGPGERVWCDKVLNASWRRHERSLAHLNNVLGLFHDAGIPCIALKGPALALRHYQPPFLRKPSLDLDLGVREADLARACQSLVRAGYEAPGSMREAIACSHHLVLAHRTKPTVELHFRLTHRALGIPVADVFDRARPFQLPGGRETLVLEPADEILHLILHLAHARFDNLFHAYEARRIWRAAPAGVREEVVRRAARHRFSGILSLVDIAFRVRWGEPFLAPDTPLEKTWLHWRIGKDLYEAFEQSAQPGSRHTVISRLRANWLEFQLTDGPADAARFTRFMATMAWFQLRRGGWNPVHKKEPVPLG